MDYMPDNGLCPGNTRSNGAKTPLYDSTFVFDNDFPALQKVEIESDQPLEAISWNNENKITDQENSIFYRSKPATGKCRVMCFHPKSNVTIPLMTSEELLKIITEWAKEVDELQKEYCYVQVFENKGALRGFPQVLIFFIFSPEQGYLDSFWVENTSPKIPEEKTRR